MPTPAQQLQAAGAALARAVTERNSIAVVIGGLQSADPGAAVAVALANAQRAYETAAADVALGKATQAEVGAARQAVEALESKRIAAERQSRETTATLAGLRGKLAVAEQALQMAEASVSEAKGEYLRAEVDAADAVYLAAASKVDKALRRINACKAALSGMGFSVLPGGDVVPFNAAGPISAAAAQARNGGSHGWGVSMFPPHDLPGDRAALASELAGILAD